MFHFTLQLLIVASMLLAATQSHKHHHRSDHGATHHHNHSQRIDISSLQGQFVVSPDYVHKPGQCPLRLLGMRYFSYLNETSYVECNHQGLGAVKQCQRDTKRHRASDSIANKPLKCAKLPFLRFNSSTMPVNETWKNETTCDYCLNAVQGLCVENVEKTSSCVCFRDYMGPLCEIPIANFNKTAEYEQILNSTNTFESYVEVKVDSMLNATNMTESQMSPTYSEFWTGYIDALWTEINTPGVFMRQFNYSQLTDPSRIRVAIRQCAIETKYAAREFQPKFALFRHVLDKIAADVHKSSESFQLNLKNYALEQMNEANESLQTGQLQATNETVHDLTARFQRELDLTANTTAGLNISYSLFRSKKCQLARRGQHVSTCSFVESPYVREVVDMLNNASQANWNMIVDYGLWYLTSTFAVGRQTSDKVIRMGRSMWPGLAKMALSSRIAGTDSSNTNPILRLSNQFSGTINQQNDITVSNKLSLELWRFW